MFFHKKTANDYKQKRFPLDKSKDEGSKAAFRDPRDPVIELDISGKNLTDIGFFPVADTLVNALTYDGEQGRCTRLEELCLQGNQLTVVSLQALARVILVCDQDLRDLDLSDNNITITTDEEAELWEDFLTSFQECYVLRRLDISGNSLGPRAFEVFTRVYACESAVDFILPPDFEETQYEVQSPTTGMSDPVRKAKKMSIGSDPDDHAGDEVTSPRAQKRKFSKQGWLVFLCFTRAVLTPFPESKSPEKTEAPDLPAGPLPIHKTTKGLRSVPYLILCNTSMTNTCALHLSFVVAYHHAPNRLLTRVPPPKAGSHTQQLIDYDSQSQCQGIIYLPNETLGARSAGLKVLELAEIFRVEPLEGAEEEFPESSHTQITLSNAPRRVSGAQSSSPMVIRGNRRRSAGVGREGEDRSVALATNLDRARSKIQSETLGQAGPLSNDLWGASLKMLYLGREIQPRVEKKPETKNETPPAPKARAQIVKTLVIPGFTPKPRPPPLPLSSQRDPNAPLLPWGNFPVKGGGLVPPTPTVIAPTPFHDIQFGGPESTSSSGDSTPTGSTPIGSALKDSVPEESTPKATKGYRSDLPCQLPEDVWRRVIAFAAGAHGVMSVGQQRSMLQYSMDLKTLSKENEQLGLTRANQIWKVLEATGCLSYEMVI